MNRCQFHGKDLFRFKALVPTLLDVIENLMNSQKTLSVVVPAYNEEEVLGTFHERLAEVLDSLDMASEVIYVNDGSRDGTLKVLWQLQAEDNRVAIVNLSRNFGKEIALTAGIHHATSDAVVVIDADLQDPPELIPEFVRIWAEDGADVVYGQRLSRDGETWLKKTTSSLFYKLMQNFGRVTIPKDTGDFRLMDRRAIEALNQLNETHRFMKGLFTWIGFDQRALPYRRDARFAGETKWNYWRLWNLALEGITSFSVVPLHVATYLGLLVAACAFLFGAFIVVKTLLFGDVVQGYPTLATIILFLGGVQLLFIGVLGEYLGRVFNETKGRPLYFVKDFRPSARDSAKPPARKTRPRKAAKPADA